MEDIADCTQVFKSNYKNDMINKHIIKSRQEKEKIRQLNKDSGKFCTRCHKPMSYMEFSISPMCRTCLLIIKQECVHLTPKL